MFYIYQFGWRAYLLIKCYEIHLPQRVYLLIKLKFSKQIEVLKTLIQNLRMKKISLIDLKGGLGNQIFHASLHLKNSGHKTFIDLSFFDQDNLFQEI